MTKKCSLACPSKVHFDRLVHGVLDELCRIHGVRIHRIEAEVAEFLESFPWSGSSRQIKLEMYNILDRGVREGRDSGVFHAIWIPLPSRIRARKVQDRVFRYLNQEYRFHKRPKKSLIFSEKKLSKKVLARFARLPYSSVSPNMWSEDEAFTRGQAVRIAQMFEIFEN